MKSLSERIIDNTLFDVRYGNDGACGAVDNFLRLRISDVVERGVRGLMWARFKNPIKEAIREEFKTSN